MRPLLILCFVLLLGTSSFAQDHLAVDKSMVRVDTIDTAPLKNTINETKKAEIQGILETPPSNQVSGIYRFKNTIVKRALCFYTKSSQPKLA